MPVKFCPIASGSSGNCVYVGTEGTHILIDAGISVKRIDSGLQHLDVSGNQLAAIFVTHEHVDHILGVGIISRKYNVPIYATPKTWRYFERHGTLGKISEDNKRIIQPDAPCRVNDIFINAFEIPHDSSEPVGYCIFADGYKISVATDMGVATDIIRENITDSHVIFLESNHDIEMLINGKYPKMLKDRVLGNKGHLSNAMAGQLLSEVISKRTKYIFLAHLSKENNRPLIALDTVSTMLTINNMPINTNFKLFVAERDFVSEVVTLGVEDE